MKKQTQDLIKELLLRFKTIHIYIFCQTSSNTKKHWSSSPAVWLFSSSSDGRQLSGVNQTLTTAKFSPIYSKTSARVNNWEVKQFFNLLSNLTNYLQLN